MKRRITFSRNECLGRGSYGFVYRGKLKSINEVGQSVVVAVKRILFFDFTKPIYMEREIQSMMSLNHRNVLKLLHHERDEDFFYLALELCEASLRDYCSSTLEDRYYSIMPRLSPDPLLQMAQGLGHIHSRKLVHRDIKPSNILISVRGVQAVLKISDFGFSKETSYRNHYSGDYGSFSVVGTEIFMAPELCYLSGTASGMREVDIFALGCVFYCFLTTKKSRAGGHPFGPINWNEIRFPDQERIKHNIRRGNSDLRGLQDGGHKDLIKDMIRTKIGTTTDCRPDIQQVIKILDLLPPAWNVTLKSYLEDSTLIDRMCNDYVALLQMAKELERFHSKNMAHGDIKPENISIDVGKNGVVFKLSTPKLETYKPLANDISALGLVFIQFLVVSLALSPGKSNKTNLQGLRDRNHWAEDIIRNMIRKEPSKRLKIGMVIEKLKNQVVPSVPQAREHQLLQCFEDTEIGRGNETVYKGKFNNKDVAVKRIELKQGKIREQEREVRTMMFLEHPNVLQLFYADMEMHIWRLALEICDGNLRQLIENKLYEDQVVIDDGDGLVQMAEGLEYIHRKKLVHRDIKPQNILVKRSSVPTILDYLIYKISDFGHTKWTSDGDTHSVSLVRGTPGFFAPEQFEQMPNCGDKGTTASDVFALGIAFHIFLPSSNGTRGKHPFKLENSQKTDDNIIDGKYKIEVNEPWAELIKDMIQKDPKLRAKLPSILDRLRNVPVERTLCNCAFDRTGRRMACVFEFGTLAMFQGDPHVPFEQWSQSLLQVSSDKEIAQVAWNMDGTEIGAGCCDGTVVVWEHSEDKWVESSLSAGNNSAVSCIEWNSYNPKLLAIGSVNGGLEVWDTHSRNKFWSYDLKSEINDIVWIDSQDLVSCTGDSEIKLWRIDDNPPTGYKHLFDRKKATSRIGWNQEDQQLATCSWNSFTIWDIDEEVTEAITIDVGFQPHCIDWYRSPDNSVVAVGGDNGSVNMWRLGFRQKKYELKVTDEGQGTVTDVSVSPNGQYLAALSKHASGCNVTIWFVGSPTPVKKDQFLYSFSLGRPYRKLLNWSPTGQKLALANSLKKVIVLEIPSEP